MSPSPPRPEGERRLAVSAVLLAAAIFILDLQVPLGVAVCALYGVVVLFGLFTTIRGFALWMAVMATLLTTVDAALSPPELVTANAITNRGLTIVGVWVTAWLVSQAARTGLASCPARAHHLARIARGPGDARLGFHPRRARPPVRSR
jgi:hypothetical protein